MQIRTRLIRKKTTNFGSSCVHTSRVYIFISYNTLYPYLFFVRPTKHSTILSANKKTFFFLFRFHSVGTVMTLLNQILACESEEIESYDHLT